jgi:hypothetical protein
MKRPRANIQANRMASGKLKITLREATAKLKDSASLSLGLSQVGLTAVPPCRASWGAVYGGGWDLAASAG